MRKRNRTSELGLLERVMFSIMGPPQVGDVNAPTTITVDPAAAQCHRCGQRWDPHERVHTGSMIPPLPGRTALRSRRCGRAATAAFDAVRGAAPGATHPRRCGRRRPVPPAPLAPRPDRLPPG